MSRARRAHAERVAALLGEWAASLGLGPQETTRWVAAGMLHDGLREAPPEELRPLVPATFRHLTGGLLHGPAAAERLRLDGVTDEPVLQAIAYHTIGHPDLDELGRALFIADYIEPGRRHDQARLAKLRGRMPDQRNAVLVDVLRARMERTLSEGRSIRSETAAFWNRVGTHAAGRAQDVESRQA
ncbi:MAG TPA: HD domain-containing protein [Longimicrobiales bacterium]|nr:HD domain-containing protein [Longimicrobiales bacterium]